MTAFSALASLCGLSLREAADFLGVKIDRVKSWGAGRNGTPPGVMDELRGLHVRQRKAAAHNLAIIRKAKPETIELGLAADDHEAQLSGWPCVGAQMAMYALIIARTNIPIRIVPAASTPATAAAADQRP